MSTQIIRGTNLPQLQWTEIDTDPIRGPIIRQFFKGISQDQMAALESDYTRSGCATRLKYLKGNATLEVEDSTRQFTTDTWQITPNNEIVDVWLNPFVAQEILSVYPADADYQKAIAAIRQHLAQDDSAPDAFADNALKLLLLTVIPTVYVNFQGGLTGYDNAVDGVGYVLRHTTNAPNRFSGNVADIGTGQIYTQAQLLAEVEDSGLWINPLPASYAFFIANIAAPPFKVNWLVGWFKGRSTRVQAANNRIEFTTEYTYGQFPMSLYDPY